MLAAFSGIVVDQGGSRTALTATGGPWLQNYSVPVPLASDLSRPGPLASPQRGDSRQLTRLAGGCGQCPRHRNEAQPRSLSARWLRARGGFEQMGRGGATPRLS
jgi:hypothetical protein